MPKSGLFVGMIALDLVYLAAKPPSNNQKIVASDYTIAAGGPATNAAVTFNYLGNQAKIVGVVGIHPITQLIRSDLANCGVKIVDLNPTTTEAPPIASIIVTQATGDRAVISIAAAKIDHTNQITATLDNKVDIVLIDGHQMSAGYAIAKWAKNHNIPVIIDGGSWKPGFENILPYVNYAICSTNFHPPNCHNHQDTIAYLTAAGITNIAITQGEKPIIYASHGITSQVTVPSIQPVDTMGAGDIFHGAFCYYILQQDFKEALAAAAKIAAHSCQFFGTRQWMTDSIS